MNYLAHAFLSGTNSELLIGNFIADSVRGKQALQYSEEIQHGIMLHRQIDTFTDANAIVHETKERLRPGYGKYAPVIADMYYDHFLAANFEKYSGTDLRTFSAETYAILQQNWNLLPERIKQFLPYMMRNNWLLGYSKIDGITQALQGLSRRTTFESGMETAGKELQKNYQLYAAEFERFFPELIAFTSQWLEQFFRKQ